MILKLEIFGVVISSVDCCNIGETTFNVRVTSVETEVTEIFFLGFARSVEVETF